MEEDADNVGRWDQWYVGLDAASPYGDVRSYEVGGAFLADCELVEDWGCGKGWMRQYVAPSRYRGIDGSRTPFADVIADLRDYRSDVDGVFVRHVLEHNYDWPTILSNVLASARRHCAIVLFTPLAAEQTLLNYVDEIGVPDLALPRAGIEAALHAHSWTMQTEASQSFYGVETMFLISSPNVDHAGALQRVSCLGW